jgi:protoporphyrinogen oxidase
LSNEPSHAAAIAERGSPAESPKETRVAVVGAGLAGLRAANALAARGCRVIVLEERSEAGGKVAGTVVDGFSVDRSLQLLSFEDRNLLGFARELKVGDRLLPLRAITAGQVHAGQVVGTSARTLRGIARTPGVRLRDTARLLRLPRLMARYAPLLDPARPERAADLDYRSLADFARLYLGQSVLEHFAGPLATNVTLGDEHEQSRVAWLLLWHASRHGLAQQGIAGGGLDVLARAAADAVDVRTDVRVLALEQTPSGGFTLDCATSVGDQTLAVEAVVLATSASEAQRIALSVVTPAERDFFAGVRSGPLVTLSVGVDHPLVGAPQLIRVPHVEGSPIEVMLVEPGAPGGRAPEGHGLVTLSATARFANRRAAADDATVESELKAELARLVPKTSTKFRFARLHRDAHGVPRFDVGAYRALAGFRRVQADRRGLGRRLYYAGDYLAGPRFEDAICSGQRAADELVSEL